MSPISIKALASLAAFATFSNAHMIMRNPIPMGSPDNSPLEKDGSNFPCKFTGSNGASAYSTAAGTNKYTAGQKYPLDFTGSAVHGGGSCQVSLTTDLEPTKDTKWMVIHSIEGGCPANVAGNLAADPNGQGASTFQFEIPSSMPSGQYTIAWTWNNKIGNREMYMNCGRAEISGAAKKRYAPAPPVFKRDAYPDILVANLVDYTNCLFAENATAVIKYPNPGPALEHVGTDTPMLPTGNCGGSGSNSPAPSSGGSDSSSAAPQPTSSAASNASQTTSAGGVFATVQPSGGSDPVPTTSAAAPPSQETSQAPPSVPSSTAAAPPSQGTGSSSVGGTQSGSCSSEGAWACAPDGNSFQRCASGMWSAPMQMSAGTTCTPGVSNTFAMNAVGHSKRDFQGHLSRRRHANVLS